jgi:glycosyltransferase involved in cell wall biosynthesis
MSRLTILIFSFEPWGRMWYSKHHYAATLAKAHDVYFVSTPRKWRITDLFRWRLKLQPTQEGVTIVNYSNLLPLRLLPAPISRLVQRRTAKKLATLLGTETNILWAFHPTSLITDRTFNKTCKVIYHVVDPYDSFAANVPCAKRADLVVAVNPWFHDRYLKLNPNTMLVPHGISHRAAASNPLIDNLLPDLKQFVILAGTLDGRVDYDLLIQVTQRIPDLNLVLTGTMPPVAAAADKARRHLLQSPNVHATGPLHPDELAYLIRHSLAGLLAYRIEPFNLRPEHSYGSMKPLTYLAQMKPVITTVNCFLPTLMNKAVYKVESETDFINKLQDALNGKLLLDVDLVREYVNEHSYGRLANMIIERLLAAGQDILDSKQTINLD